MSNAKANIAGGARGIDLLNISTDSDTIVNVAGDVSGLSSHGISVETGGPARNIILVTSDDPRQRITGGARGINVLNGGTGRTDLRVGSAVESGERGEYGILLINEATAGDASFTLSRTARFDRG